MSRLAAFSAQIRTGPLPPLFALSGLAYLLLAVMPQAGGVVALCGDFKIIDLWRVAQTAPVLWSPGWLVTDWGLMIVSMMTPLTALQVSHVYRSSPSSCRAAAVAVFLGAYWTLWFTTILFLFPLAVVLQSIAGTTADFPASLMFALIHSASPIAQRARNGCHRTGRVAAFGVRNLSGCANQGLVTGASCIAACWPWMLVPMTVQSLHLTLMVLIGVYLFADRIAPTAPPAWRLPPAWETLFGPLWPGMPRIGA